MRRDGDLVTRFDDSGCVVEIRAAQFGTTAWVGDGLGFEEGALHETDAAGSVQQSGEILCRAVQSGLNGDPHVSEALGQSRVHVEDQVGAVGRFGGDDQLGTGAFRGLGQAHDIAKALLRIDHQADVREVERHGALDTRRADSFREFHENIGFGVRELGIPDAFPGVFDARLVSSREDRGEAVESVVDGFAADVASGDFPCECCSRSVRHGAFFQGFVECEAA